MLKDLRHNNDRHTFVFANGKGRGLGRIENVRWSWKKLKRKLSEPMVDTSVTFAQYEALDQDEKLVKKRAPGSWTPSRYRSNRRAIADLREKTLIVYDLDYVTRNQLDDIKLGLAPISEFAWFMHTTRGHFPESPRARMILPVSRPMKPDEAHAVFRLLATKLADDPEEGIEIPDLVSFRGNQTMFYPSISRGQEFWTSENVAPILDVDEFLAENPGWEDFENLPYQVEESNRGKIDPNRRMEDPYKKPEPMGAFNRAYTVQEVIANWLTEVYAPGDSESEERYTYLLGTGSNGAVVYEDGKFLHSNHGSDPVQTCNAFDLCRLHMFGHLDAEAHHNTAPGNMPSFKAMMEFARQDERVIGDLYQGFDDTLDDLEDEDTDQDEGEDDGDDSDLGSMLDDLGDDDEDEPEEPKKEKADKSWIKNLRRKANGELEPVLNNVALIVEHDRRIKDCISYNEFTYDPVCRKPIRAPKISTPSKTLSRRDRKRGRRWEDADDMSIQLICSGNNARGGYETDFPRNQVETAVLSQGMRNPVHPVKELIQSHYAKWQKKGSPTGALDSWVVDYLGCPDTPFHRESARVLMIAAVARIYEPGCKFDVMPVIEGATGSRKSTFWSTLFGGFVTELDCDLDRGDRVIENLRGNWAVEMAEMAAAKKAESNMLKMRLTQQCDVHRLAYAKREQEFPRQSIWVGTSNEDDYLTDPTSNRRFWVWKSPKDRFDPIDTDALESNLWQIIGEAYQSYVDMREAEPYKPLFLDLQSPEVIREAIEIAEGSRRATAVETMAEGVQEWLDQAVPAEECEGVDGVIPDDAMGDGTPMVRNMVTAKMVFDLLEGESFMRGYRNTNPSTMGRVLKLVPGWRCIERQRRHGVNAVWFVRGEDGPLWVNAAGSDTGEIDDLLS